MNVLPKVGQVSREGLGRPGRVLRKKVRGSLR
jgi:hypothetical protein